MKTKKLRLNFETIHRLDTIDLMKVAGASLRDSACQACTTACSIACTTTGTGGGGSTPYTCNPCSMYCQTGGTGCTAGGC